jgi:hypothetical protein
MNERATIRQQNVLAPTPTPLSKGILQDRCACGGVPGPTGECAGCRKERLGLQRRAASLSAVPSVPSVVHDVLRSPGRPLDAQTRAFMEPRFGHDFGRVRVRSVAPAMSGSVVSHPEDESEREADRVADAVLGDPQGSEPGAAYDFGQVRVHTDAKAAESAAALGALAYTVGPDVVFDAGRYEPETAAGRELLAHELTHVVQQTATAGGTLASESAAETQALQVSRRIEAGDVPLLDMRVPAGTLQRQQDRTPLDDTAKAIIAKAKDEKTAVDERAVQAVKSIIKSYYPSDEAKVDSVVYDDAKAGSGVRVTSKGSGESTKGIIYVGKTFLDGVTERHFPRRVLQVGHELEHITQWRTGMAGGKKSDEREFLAFHHEALAAEKPGTGRMQRSTRVALIDAALGYYYCLTTEQQKQYAANKKELLDRRPGEVKASGQASTDPPTECKRQ